MKKSILILMLLGWVLVGCSMSDDDDSCPQDMRLVFHHGGSAAGFDSEIGNDVYLHIYKDDILFRAVEIPYADIQGGKEYIIRKEFTGNLSFAAFAGPPTCDATMIPRLPAGHIFSTGTFGHTRLTRAPGDLYLPMEDVYLGAINVGQDQINRRTTHYIDMASAVCNVRVIADPELFAATTADGDPLIHIGGCAAQATLSLQCGGEEVTVPSTLNVDPSSTLLSTDGYLGMLPSFEQRPLSVTAYSGDRQLFTVRTSELSQAGKRVVIILGARAEIYVNGWRVEEVEMDWL